MTGYFILSFDLVQYSKVGSMNLSTSTKKNEAHNFVVKKEISAFNPKAPHKVFRFESIDKKLGKKKEITNHKNIKKSPFDYSEMNDDISRLKLEKKKISSKDKILNLNPNHKKVSISYNKGQKK